MADTPKTSMLATGLQSGWDVRMRHVAGSDPRFFDYGRYGLLTDDSVLGQRIRGGGRYAGESDSTGSGSVRINQYGGGSTPSNPGGYNYATLQNAASTVGENAAWAFSARAHRRQRDQETQMQQQQEAARQSAQQAAFKGIANFNRVTGNASKTRGPYGMLNPPGPMDEGMSSNAQALLDDIYAMEDPSSSKPSKSNNSRTQSRKTTNPQNKTVMVTRRGGAPSAPPSSPTNPPIEQLSKDEDD